MLGGLIFPRVQTRIECLVLGKSQVQEARVYFSRHNIKFPALLPAGCALLNLGGPYVCEATGRNRETRHKPRHVPLFRDGG